MASQILIIIKHPNSIIFNTLYWKHRHGWIRTNMHQQAIQIRILFVRNYINIIQVIKIRLYIYLHVFYKVIIKLTL